MDIKDNKIQAPIEDRLVNFTNAYRGMIATNDAAYNTNTIWGSRKRGPRVKEYSLEEIERIIESGSIDEQVKLSRNYFYKGGIYSRLIMYYATLPKYYGMLIPNPSFGKSLSEPYIQKKYFSAINFLDNINLKEIFTHFAVKAFIDGTYYGVIQDVSKDNITIIDLPARYCASNFKYKSGADAIEFDVTYFDKITNEEARKGALRTYPKCITNWYRRYKNGKVTSKWVYIPEDTGICLPFLDGKPFFLEIIPAIIKYDKTVDINNERDLEEIRKILVQKIPHLQDGRLLFEPQEAEVIHQGSVKMMSNNPNVSVLTTYADVDAIISKTTNDSVTPSLQAALTNVYSTAGTSNLLFGSDSNMALDTSINNDMALILPFVYALEDFITRIINNTYSNANIKFRYMILPITQYNSDKYIDTALKLANSGYSFLLPAIAMGFSQKELNNVKDLENDVLGLKDKLIPLSTSYTESASSGNVGRPEKPDSEKSEKTVANITAKDKGGSSQNDS